MSGNIENGKVDISDVLVDFYMTSCSFMFN